MSRSVVRALACAVVAVALADCSEPSGPVPLPEPSAVLQLNTLADPSGPYPVLAGAGDVANCAAGNDNDGSTARLLDAIFANGQPGNVMMLGEPDETATPENYPGCFVDTWGRHVPIMRPMPGNKDYINGNIDHYFRYFGAAAGEAPGAYYSFDVGEYWHVVVINSNNSFVPTNTDAAPQVAWLRNDLLLNTKPCIAAFMHHPRFFSSTTPNVSTETGSLRPVWNELYKHGVEFVASGNRHHYERLKPMRADGTVDLERGVIQFISGTGGTSLGLPQDGIGSIHPNTDVRGLDYGVVKFTLKPDGYDWQFVPARNRFNDAGSANCHPPTIPVALLVSSSAASSVYGAPVTFTAKAEDGTNTVRVGTVSFISGGTCEAPGDVLAAGLELDLTGRAKATISTLDAAGSPHVVTACYTGAGSYESSSGGIAHTVTEAPATVTLANLEATYDGTAKGAVATTEPAGLAVSITYLNAAGDAVTPIDAGDYSVTAIVDDPNYSGSATGLLHIAQDGNQTIDFAYPGDRTFGDPPFELSATASSGLPVAFAATGSCSVSGTTVTIDAAGSCTLTASQTGNINYQPAGDVIHTVAIAKKVATVTLGDLFHNYDGQPKSATASTDAQGSSAFAFEYSRNGLVSSQPVDAGSYGVVATLVNANYQGSASGTLIINGAPVGVEDKYNTNEDQVLNVSAPGVLANDTDPNSGQTLAAIRESGPAHGVLTLQANGSFSYTPAVDYNGTDSFTYRLTDGVLVSAPVTVTITITAVHDPPLTVKVDILPGSSTNTVPLGGSQTQIVFAVHSSSTFDATQVDPAKVTIGNNQGAEAGLARNANGTFKFMLLDVSGDGRRDFYAYVNKADLRNNGDLTLTTKSLTVNGAMKAPSSTLIRGTDKVNVIP